MADQVDPITGQKVVRVAGPAGAVSVESIGDTKYVYDQSTTTPDGKPASLTDSIAGAFAAVLGGPAAAATLDDPEGAYGKRIDARESAALDKEAADIEEEASAWQKVGSTTAKIAGDVTKGTLIEGAPAAVRGVKTAVNETLDLIESVADQVPGGVITWSGFDGDPNTPMKIEAMSGAEAKKRSFAERFLPQFKNDPKAAPTTVTGTIIEKGSQFATGMVGAGKVLKGWTAATRGGTVVKALAQGAIADFTAFDPHEERLSNMLQDMAPEQAKPIFDYLAAKEDDGEVIGRLKNAVEGAGLGAMSDAVFAGIRGIKAARLAKAEAAKQAAREGAQVPVTETAEVMARESQRTQDDIEALLGKRKGPRFSSKVASQNPTIKPGDLPGSVDPNVFDINFARIETPDDVKKVISTIIERNAGAVDDARRGKRSWAETKEEAAGYDWVNSMAKRRAGDAMNAEEVYAYRTALNASATKVLELARVAQARGDIASQFAFRRMVATHQAIQMEFMGARAEAGRALNAFKIAADTPERATRQIDALLNEMGGKWTSDALSKKILQAAEQGDIALNQVIVGGWNARSRDMISLVYTNGLLSGLGTPLVNMQGNMLASGKNLLTRMVAPRLAKMFSDAPETEIGEAAAMIHGMIQAGKDAFRLSAKEAAAKITFDAAREKGAMRALAPGLEGSMPEGLARGMREESSNAKRPLSAAAWRVDEDTKLGRFLDSLQMLVESPSNLNALGDDFFKSIAARGELHAQAFRQMQREARAGLLQDEAAMSARARELVDNPTQEMLDTAEREMQELTFTRETPGIADSLNKLRGAMNSSGPVPWGTLLLPFLKTPANIISSAIRYSPLAPLSRRFQEDLAAGGARAEIAKAKVAVGLALHGVYLDMAMNGDLTGGGPMNRQQKEAMMREDENGAVLWQPYSVRITEPNGNRRWVSIERLDPEGTHMSIVGDLHEILANDDWNNSKAQEADEIAANVILASGQAFFNKAMLRSAQETIEAFTGNSLEKADKALKNRATSMIPFSAALRMGRRGTDPYLRETASYTDAIKNTLPGQSNDLPMQRDLWGKPRTYQSGFGTIYDAVAPVKTKAAGGSEIDLEILNNGVSVSMPPNAIQVMDERVSLKNRPDIYSDFVRLAGEPAFEHLNAVASGSHPDSDYYFSLSDGPNGGKAEYIKDVIKSYRADARNQIIAQYGEDLIAMAAQAKRAREEARQ